MAKIVLGIGSARSPMTSLPPERWAALGERDKRSRVLFELDGSPVTYDTLLERAPKDLGEALSMERWQAQYDASQRCMEALSQTIREVNPDVLIIMGDDEEEIHHADNRPAIMIYLGASFPVFPRSLPPESDDLNRDSNWTWGDHEAVYPVAQELSHHILDQLISEPFDVSISTSLPEGAPMSHGYGFVFTRLAKRMKIPTVPFFVNIHYPPNQPTPARNYALGQAIRRAVEAWPGDERVAVIGTGGLSTGVLREDQDRALLKALAEHDVEHLRTMPYKWIKGPTGEILAWVSTAGACEHLTMQLLDYIPAVRSPALTGCGITFARWQ
jgi:3-O-methylgallate 3,4-dioxygenase